MLSTIQEKIEQTLYLRLLEKAVAEGYTPNIQDATTYPSTTAGYAAYQAAVDAIVTAKGYAIKIYGTGNPESRSEKNLPRISFQSRSFVPGDIGNPTTKVLVEDIDNDKFDYYIYDGRSQEYYIDCRISADTQAQYRIAMALVNHSLPTLNYVLFNGETENRFLVELSGFIDNLDNKSGILEAVYVYKIADVFWVEPEKTTEAIPRITSISVNPSINEELGIAYSIENN